MWTDFRQFIAAQARAAFFNARAAFSLIAYEIRERSVLRNQSDVIRRATVRAPLRQRAVALRHHARRKMAPSALAGIRRYRDRHKLQVLECGSLQVMGNERQLLLRFFRLQSIFGLKSAVPAEREEGRCSFALDQRPRQTAAIFLAQFGQRRERRASTSGGGFEGARFTPPRQRPAQRVTAQTDGPGASGTPEPRPAATAKSNRRTAESSSRCDRSGNRTRAVR